MNKHFITIAIFLAALGCYFLGISKGVLILIIFGAGMELTFWYRLLINRDQQSSQTD